MFHERNPFSPVEEKRGKPWFPNGLTLITSTLTWSCPPNAGVKPNGVVPVALCGTLLGLLTTLPSAFSWDYFLINNFHTNPCLMVNFGEFTSPSHLPPSVGSWIPVSVLESHPEALLDRATPGTSFLSLVPLKADSEMALVPIAYLIHACRNKE